MEALSLPFGASWLLVPGTKAAWGARLIFPDDLVWDRHGTAGDEGLVQETLAWLNEKDIDVSNHWGEKNPMTRLGCALRKARTLADSYEMKSDSKYGYVLYLDGKGAIIATPNASYGYVYLAAYLYNAIPGGCTPQSDGTELARKYGRES